MPLSRHLLVAGDAPEELFLFPPAAQSTSDANNQTLHRTVPFKGGAHLIAHLLRDVDKSNPWVSLHVPDFSTKRFETTTLIELRHHPHDSSRTATYGLKSKRRLHDSSDWYSPTSIPPPSSTDGRSVFIFQDGPGATGKIASKPGLHLLESYRPSYLIYHMSRPLCKGELWNRVRPSPGNAMAGWDPQRLIVIVRADDLRAEGIQLSHGLSWEKTCEDFVRRLGSVNELVSLSTCPHLIVVFGCDGVIHHRGLDVSKPTLFFDPLRSEGEFFRQNVKFVPGVMETFVAGFASALMWSNEINFTDSIQAGFQAARNLARMGITVHGPDAALYDAATIMGASSHPEEDSLIKFDIPSDVIGRGDEDHWSLFDYLIGDSAEVARKIVTEGTHYTKMMIPLARFNRLEVFDRREIELFQTLFHILDEYLTVPQTKPLSIAFFGPRGSGKSFAALQVAESASAGRKVRQLRFDLSQFGTLEDLTKAFHQVRDSTLEGFIPLVYFNNFDIEFDSIPYGWIRHLLPTMSGGKFSDAGVSRPIGAAVFFFGGTATNICAQFQLDTFTPNMDPGTARLIWEFQGCLQGCVKMVGFNRVDGIDRLYPLRRAVALRSLLEDREAKLKRGNLLNIDGNVLNSLLIVPKYHHGIRSLSSIIAMSRLNNQRHFQRAALPPRSQLELHVNYEDFTKSSQGFPLPKDIRESVAEKLHGVYMEHQRDTARAKPEHKFKTPEQLDKALKLKSWEESKEEHKESSREHADAIPGKLRLIDCFVSLVREDRPKVEQFSLNDVETLAIDEKARWNSERLQRQWKDGPRSDSERTTPFLKPWEDVDEWVKDIDRAMVRSYPKVLPDNYAIYKMGQRV